MSIFGNIWNALTKVHHSQSSSTAAPQPAPAPPPQKTTAPAPSSQATAAPASAPATPVDVEAVLAQLSKTKSGGGNWQTSIVDLLKLLDIDSSLAARKELASELNVHAGADGSAEQNIALSKAVWKKLAENGGKVPDSLRD